VTEDAKYWDRPTLETRIADVGRRQRHEAGSPNPDEVERYRELLLDGPRPQQAVVLGMTPELRVMALSVVERVITVDRNPEAISLYRDWTPEADRGREWIIRADWADLSRLVTGPVDAVLGDGVFGNVLTLDGHRRLLNSLREAVGPGGRIILRHAMIPRGFDLELHSAERLLEAFRRGRMKETEFGFGMRLWGCFAKAYDRRTSLLDNRMVFDRYGRWHVDGRLTDGEWKAVQRYYYGGRNMILAQDDWETLLGECRLEYSMRPLTGRAWYAYYPVYSCRPRNVRNR
jgi:hypothetical protein